MSVTDVVATLFAVQGFSTYTNAFKAAELAQDRLRLAEGKHQASVLKGVGVENTTVALKSAQLSATKALETVTAQYGAVALSVFTAIVGALAEATRSYVDYGREVANVKDLTGATAHQAAGLVSLFRVAGIPDVRGIHDLLNLSKSINSAEQLGALSKLGVGFNPNESGFALFNKITDALQRYPDGLRKAAIEEQIFGARGVESFLPLLRMTAMQRQQIMELNSVNEEAVRVMGQFQFGSALLGETVLQKLVYPIAQRLLPSLVWGIDHLIEFTNWLGRINEATGGLLGVSAAFIGIGLAIGSVLIVLPALIAALRTLAITEAIVDAFSGNWPALAAGLAVAAGAGIVITAATGGFGAQGGNNSSLDANTQAVQQNTVALNYMTDGFDRLNRGGIPNGLSPLDIQTLANARALSAIG